MLRSLTCISASWFFILTSLKLPVNVDVTCTDHDYIQALQSQQNAGQLMGDDESVTTVSHCVQ